MRVWTLALAWLTTLPAHAQDTGADGALDPWEEVVVDPIETYTRAIGGDLDGDGDGDLVSVNHERTGLVMHMNLGPKGFAAPVLLFDEGNRVYGEVLADLDGDGDLDLVRAGQPVWHPNIGGGFGPPIPIVNTFAWVVHPVDLDGDGDLDLAYGGTKVLGWVENLGGGSFGPAQPLPMGLVHVSAVTSADLDLDGDADLITNQYFYPWISGVVAYANEGGGSFTSIALPGEPGTSDLLGPADLDGDGDVDLVVSAGSYSYTGLGWLDNLHLQGGGTQLHQLIPGIEWVEARPVDLDRDGVLDLLVQSAPNPVSAMYGLGGGQFADPVELLPPCGSSGIVDLDGDGGSDVVCVGDAWVGGLSVWRQPTGTGTGTGGTAATGTGTGGTAATGTGTGSGANAGNSGRKGKRSQDGCGCRSTPGPGGALLVGLMLLLGRRFRPVS